jgi:hypothetical protein
MLRTRLRRARTRRRAPAQGHDGPAHELFRALDLHLRSSSLRACQAAAALHAALRPLLDAPACAGAGGPPSADELLLVRADAKLQRLMERDAGALDFGGFQRLVGSLFGGRIGVVIAAVRDGIAALRGQPPGCEASGGGGGGVPERDLSPATPSVSCDMPAARCSRSAGSAGGAAGAGVDDGDCNGAAAEAAIDPEDPRVRRLFDAFDADADGRLSFMEVALMLARLSPGASLSTARAGAVECLLLYDEDGDGALSRAEFAALLERLLSLGGQSLDAALGGLLAKAAAPPQPPARPSAAAADAATLAEMRSRRSAERALELLGSQKFHALFDVRPRPLPRR